MRTGVYRFAGQGGVAAGVRRIEAVTGPGAYQAVARIDRELEAAAGLMKALKRAKVEGAVIGECLAPGKAPLQVAG